MTNIYPLVRSRRLRRSEAMRRLVRETRLSIDNFIYPLFVVHGTNVKQEIASMPGVYHWSIDRLAAEAEEIASCGIPGVILFGLPAHKDEAGSESFDDRGIVQLAVREIKQAAPELVVATDVCMCEYTDHGHCGIVKDRTVQNDETLQVLGEIAVSQASAGADVVAPSAMMDGQVAAIREALDRGGHEEVAILAYSAKYASSFYGPFRDAAQSPPSFGDRHAYQMDPANLREAHREVALDIDEGADIIMIKPALAYMDVIRRVRDEFDHPVAAYNVSGEYSMVKAAAANGWIDEQAATMEILTSLRRAGADLILSYHAKEVAGWLKEGV